MLFRPSRLRKNSVRGVGAAASGQPVATPLSGSMLPYTLGVLRWLKISPFLILAPVCAICQVQVTVPAQSFKASERIAAKVANVGDHEILYCVEFGQTSFKGPGVENMETTPIPFYVQRKSGGRWSTLMIGPDVGSVRSSVVLEPGQSHEFPFRLNDKGEMRLVLEYWIGEKAVNCKNPPRGEKKTHSKIFAVQ